MQRLCSASVLLLLCCCLWGSQANRVYVHPFSLFASPNISCQTVQTQEDKPLETLPVAPLDTDVLTPDARGSGGQEDGTRQNVTERTVVLAELLNSLGLRIYQNSAKQRGVNVLFSPVNTFGSLVTFYLGASIKTASSYQELLGLSRETDPKDCVSLVDGHKVLKTLQSINSLVDDGPKDEIETQVWAFTRKDTRLAQDFVQGTQDFSDASFIRSVDFSSPQEAEQQVNTFMEKTSAGKTKGLFKGLSSSTNLLFISSYIFRGNWKTAFQPERMSIQQFHVDDSTTVEVPLMTHTGRYQYLNDKMRRCTVVKLELSERSNMLIVLPHEGANLHDIESQLLTEVLFKWHQNLKEGLLELSLPKFSVSAVTDMRDLLTNMNVVVEAKLLGSEAEFDRLSTTRPFTIDKAFNKLLFEMSEEGAELENINQEAGVPLKLTVNRPFLFFVTEKISNAILILGKIVNPTL